MWHSMWAVQIPILEKILRTVFVYATIVILFRLVGKRDLAVLNTFDFVVIFLLSNVVQNAVIGNDNSVLGGVIGAVTLVGVNSLLNRWLAISARATRLLEGTPTTVIEDGRFVPRALHRLSLRREDIEHAVRMQSGDDVSEIGTGRIEPTGQLVLTLKPEEQSATKGDIRRLNARLDAIHSALVALASAKLARYQGTAGPGAPATSAHAAWRSLAAHGLRGLGRSEFTRPGPAAALRHRAGLTVGRGSR